MYVYATLQNSPMYVFDWKFVSLCCMFAVAAIGFRYHLAIVDISNRLLVSFYPLDRDGWSVNGKPTSAFRDAANAREHKIVAARGWKCVAAEAHDLNLCTRLCNSRPNFHQRRLYTKAHSAWRLFSATAELSFLSDPCVVSLWIRQYKQSRPCRVCSVAWPRALLPSCDTFRCVFPRPLVSPPRSPGLLLQPFHSSCPLYHLCRQGRLRRQAAAGSRQDTVKVVIIK